VAESPESKGGDKIWAIWGTIIITEAGEKRLNSPKRKTKKGEKGGTFCRSRRRDGKKEP